MSDIERIEGLFVGQLNPQELKLFEDAVSEHLAYREYSGASGFLGLAKVRLIRAPA